MIYVWSSKVSEHCCPRLPPLSGHISQAKQIYFSSFQLSQWPYKPKTIRPAGSPPMLMSKYTCQLSILLPLLAYQSECTRMYQIWRYQIYTRCIILLPCPAPTSPRYPRIARPYWSQHPGKDHVHHRRRVVVELQSFVFGIAAYSDRCWTAERHMLVMYPIIPNKHK